MIAYTIAPALESGVFDVGDRLDRLGGDRRRSRGTTAPRCRSCARRRLPATRRRTSSGSSTRSTELRGQGRSLGLLQPAAADQPVPQRRTTIRRAWDALHGAGRASTRCARSRSARSIRARCGSCAATACCRCCRSVAGAQQPVAQHARTRRCRRSTCRTRRSRSPGRAWCSRAARSPATCVVPFLTEGYEGFDINDPHDWMLAERLIADGAATLPAVDPRPA